MFADIIKVERAKRGLSQRELGELVGVTQQAIGRWETGQALPDTSTLIRLADLFHLSTDYLLDRKDFINAPSAEQIDDILINHPELLAFWIEAKKRPDLQLFLNQVKAASPKVIKQMMAFMKAIEGEE